LIHFSYIFHFNTYANHVQPKNDFTIVSNLHYSILSVLLGTRFILTILVPPWQVAFGIGMEWELARSSALLTCPTWGGESGKRRKRQGRRQSHREREREAERIPSLVNWLGE